MIEHLIRVAGKREIAPLVLKNGRVICLPTGEVIAADLAIADGYIAGVGSYEGQEEIDLKAGYVAPGLIESHIHIESSLVTPREFLQAAARFGTTTVVADPHEIVNVLGLDGIKYMLDDSREALIDLFLEVPSCVPATHLETGGAQVGARQVTEALDYPRVIGLGEVMNFAGVIAGDAALLDKINAARQRGMTVAGHAPLLTGAELNAYLAAGIQSDHEAVTLEEGREKLRLGMRVLLRYGSAARDIFQLYPLVSERTAPYIALCADDRHPEDLLEAGHLNLHLVYLAARGIDPLLALRLATTSPAQHYGFSDRGIIAPGKLADLVVYDDLQHFKPRMVWKRGKLIVREGQVLDGLSPEQSGDYPQTVHFDSHKIDLSIKAERTRVRAIKLLPNQILTEALEAIPPVKDGFLNADPAQDLLKLAVIERHGRGGTYHTGFLSGYGLKRGAIAQTIAHDSHNVVVTGVSDTAMDQALARLQTIGGGIVLWDEEKFYELPLPIAGLMSPWPLNKVKERLQAIIRRARALGVPEGIDPVVSLSFIALPVIPHLRLTDRGLVDSGKMEFTSLFIDE